MKSTLFDTVLFSFLTLLMAYALFALYNTVTHVDTRPVRCFEGYSYLVNDAGGSLVLRTAGKFKKPITCKS